MRDTHRLAARSSGFIALGQSIVRVARVVGRVLFLGAFVAAPQVSAADAALIEAPLPPILPWSGPAEAIIVSGDDRWVTPAERDSFRLTPSYSETKKWLERLVAASPLLTLQSFGISGEGRELFYERASSPPGGADDHQRPVVLIQAGIHSHEIDGKDAGLMLLRDIGQGDRAALITDVDLVFVPIYNVDGHEQSSVFNAPHLRGPENPGTRKTAQRIAVALGEKMLADDRSLRAEFEARLASDPDFAQDAEARLRWFRDRSGYAERRLGSYPITRELR